MLETDWINRASRMVAMTSICVENDIASARAAAAGRRGRAAGVRLRGDGPAPATRSAAASRSGRPYWAGLIAAALLAVCLPSPSRSQPASPSPGPDAACSTAIQNYSDCLQQRDVCVHDQADLVESNKRDRLEADQAKGEAAASKKEIAVCQDAAAKKEAENKSKAASDEAAIKGQAELIAGKLGAIEAILEGVNTQSRP
jgi:hypothetical protein